MSYRRRAAAVISAIALFALLMEFSEVLFPELSDDPADRQPVRPTVTTLFAFGYAALIAFKKSLVFTPTAKRWKRILLVILAVAGVLFVLIHGFSVPFVGFVLSGLIFAACLLWFDSNVREEQAKEQDLSQR